MDKAHDIQYVSFSGMILHMRVDGKDYRIDVSGMSDRVRNATQQQRENFDISPSGYGIYWADVDEDLSIDGLIGVKHASPLIKDEV
jgi:hypothetical protein